MKRATAHTQCATANKVGILKDLQYPRPQYYSATPSEARQRLGGSHSTRETGTHLFEHLGQVRLLPVAHGQHGVDPAVRNVEVLPEDAPVTLRHVRQSLLTPVLLTLQAGPHRVQGTGCSHVPSCPPGPSHSSASQPAGRAMQGAGCRVQGAYRVQSRSVMSARAFSHQCFSTCRQGHAGRRVQGSGYRVQGSGCRVHGTGFRDQGTGCMQGAVTPSTVVSARSYSHQ